MDFGTVARTILRITDWVSLKLSKHRTHHATAIDVYNCYRILLNRNPDSTGFAEWNQLISTHPFPVINLMEGFVYGREFMTLQAERNKPKLVQSHDFSIYVRLNDQFVGAGIAHNGLYELGVTHVVKTFVKPGMVVVDIGANIGFFTMMAAKLVGESGRVIAYEPNSENVHSIEMSVEANSFENVMVHPHAVSNREGTIALEVGGVNSNGRIVTTIDDEYERPLVRTVKLDDQLAALSQIDFIKMDIEGAEPLAVQGMLDLLKRHQPVIVLEFSPNLIQQTSQIAPLAFLHQLAALDYSFQIVHDEGAIGEPIEPADILAMCDNTAAYHLDLLLTPK